MWYSATTTKMIQKYLNIYSQIQMHFDVEGNIHRVDLFIEGKWITSPTLAKQMQLQHVVLPVRQKASILLKR